MNLQIPFFSKNTAAHPLAQLSNDRTAVVEEVVQRTCQQIPPQKVEPLVADSIFWEKKRLEKPSDPIRDALDNAFWRDVSSQYRDAGETHDETMKFLMKKIVRYNTEEIAGNFSENVYSLATVAVPRGLGWLFQAASWKSVRNLVGENVDLRRKIHLQGKLNELRKLAQLGTVVLVPTHFSNLDSPLIGWALYDIGLPPFCYGAGLNLFTNPVFGYFMNNLGAYKVDRRKKHEIYKDTLKNYSTVTLERGCHSLFFPGGGRSRSGGLESKIKLGLLGTTIDAYVENLLKNREKPKIFIVPCVISYHFVLEAATLIDDFLAEHGKSRYIIEDDESSKPKLVAQFMYKFFKASSSVYVNFGNAIDPFGNLVDENGESLGAHGQTIDIRNFVKSGGDICHNPQRDHEYARILGERIVSRYRVENVALTSHFVAFAYFEMLRQKFSSSDLFKLFRLSEEDTGISFEEFSNFATPLLEKLHKLYSQGRLLLEPALRSTELKNILDAAQRNMGVYHTKRPLKLVQNGDDQRLFSEDLKLLFYYHNRMEGYALTEREPRT